MPSATVSRSCASQAQGLDSWHTIKGGCLHRLRSTYGYLPSITLPGTIQFAYADKVCAASKPSVQVTKCFECESPVLKFKVSSLKRPQ